MKVIFSEEGASAFSSLARKIIASPRFVCSDLYTEKNGVVTSVIDELYPWAKVSVSLWEAQQEYSEITNACMEEDGYIHMNAALRHFEQKQSRLEEPHFDAEQALETALMEQIAESILEALHLVGVSDEGVKAEICRVVIQGGVLLDGKGFMEGQSVEATETERKAA